jgi:predicted DNA-binding transcriptional regulator AlpA
MNTSIVLLRPKEAMRRTGLGHSSFYQAVAYGILPQPVKIIPGGRASGFPEHEIDAFVKARISSRGGGPMSNENGARTAILACPRLATEEARS